MLEMKFILSIVYLISFLALANAADGAVSSSLRGSNHRNYPTLARDAAPVAAPGVAPADENPDGHSDDHSTFPNPKSWPTWLTVVAES